eukprot:TRINITY_DN11482_c0_g1_i1.p1 TRINITY_DN11482_c0_g1~~TRINITY_DN11482_c0_g1_i1.p1  ORF type:complete len:333 (+),score=61.69 TRINITY_DN11482_c0_g1_i1:51-1049(+)
MATNALAGGALLRAALEGEGPTGHAFGLINGRSYLTNWVSSTSELLEKSELDEDNMKLLAAPVRCSIQFSRETAPLRLSWTDGIDLGHEVSVDEGNPHVAVVFAAPKDKDLKDMVLYSYKKIGFTSDEDQYSKVHIDSNASVVAATFQYKPAAGRQKAAIEITCSALGAGWPCNKSIRAFWQTVEEECNSNFAAAMEENIEPLIRMLEEAVDAEDLKQVEAAMAAASHVAKGHRSRELTTAYEVARRCKADLERRRNPWTYVKATGNAISAAAGSAAKALGSVKLPEATQWKQIGTAWLWNCSVCNLWISENQDIDLGVMRGGNGDCLVLAL